MWWWQHCIPRPYLVAALLRNNVVAATLPLDDLVALRSKSDRVLENAHKYRLSKGTVLTLLRPPLCIPRLNQHTPKDWKNT